MSNAGQTNKSPFITGAIDINILLGFVFGVIFLTVMLGFAWGIPEPSLFQTQVFMTTLAISAAGIGAVLPGALNIEFKKTVRASGALALFAIVWFSKPAIEDVVHELRWPKISPNDVVNEFLSDLDSGNPAKSYADLDQTAITMMVPALKDWQTLYDANIKPLRPVDSRKRTGVQPLISPNGMPAGNYVTFSYLTRFKTSGECRMEAVAVKQQSDESWRVYSFEISPVPQACSS